MWLKTKMPLIRPKVNYHSHNTLPDYQGNILALESASSIQKLNSNSTLDSSCYTARELTTISSKIPIFTENKTNLWKKFYFVEALMAGIIYRIRNVINTGYVTQTVTDTLVTNLCHDGKNISNQFWSVDWSIVDGWSAPGKMVAFIGLIWADRVSNGGGIDITVL